MRHLGFSPSPSSAYKSERRNDRRHHCVCLKSRCRRQAGSGLAKETRGCLPRAPPPCPAAPPHAVPSQHTLRHGCQERGCWALSLRRGPPASAVTSGTAGDRTPRLRPPLPCHGAAHTQSEPLTELTSSVSFGSSSSNLHRPHIYRAAQNAQQDTRSTNADVPRLLMGPRADKPSISRSACHTPDLPNTTV